MTRPISFLSDFGQADEFVGVVHGVIERISPGTRVIDVTHGVARGNACRCSRSAAGGAVPSRWRRSRRRRSGRRYQSAGHRGIDRSRILRGSGQWSAGTGGRHGRWCRSLRVARGCAISAPGAGSSFDGRDVFAPAAAVLASGEAALLDLGPEVDPGSVTPLLLPLVEHGEGRVSGEVWWIDGYGNAQTNVSPDDLELAGMRPGSMIVLRVGATEHEVEWAAAYGDGAAPIVHCDAHGLMAIAVPKGRADTALHISEDFRLGSGHRVEPHHENDPDDEQESDQDEDGDSGSRPHDVDGTAVSDLLFLTRKTCALCTEAYQSCSPRPSGAVTRSRSSTSTTPHSSIVSVIECRWYFAMVSRY